LLWTLVKNAFEVFVVYMAWQTLLEMRDQNKHAIEAIREAHDQHGTLQEQNHKLQDQIDLQKEQDYIARRAELYGTLYDRRENCDKSERIGVKKECPPKAALRSRQEALRAFAWIEQTRKLPDRSWADIEVESVELDGLSLRGAKLGSAKLSGASLEKTDLRGAVFDVADLSSACLNGADLSDASFSQADLRYADFREANLAGTVFYRANLRGAKLDRTNLKNTAFTYADMNGTHVNGADLSRADFTGARTGDTWICDSDLRGADELTQRQIDGCIGNENTKLPPGLILPKRDDCSRLDLRPNPSE
jgi:uncharacterized protein YjbI with pentapeptide repeats